MGNEVAILAGGLSMTPAIVEAVRASGIRAVVINNSWKLMPEADCLYAADAKWWRSKESPRPEEFLGERLHCTHKERVITKQITPAVIPGVTYVEPHKIHLGSNSALQATIREAKLGATRILLFGVDLRDDELTHHNGLHGSPMDNPTKPRFSRARAAWEAYAKQPDRPEIIN